MFDTDAASDESVIRKPAAHGTANPKLGHVTVLMKRSFDEFDAKQRATFLHELSLITGCTPDEITDTHFYSGCVVFEGILPTVAIERLIELLEKTNPDESNDELQAFREFVTTHSISDIKNNYEVNVQLVKKPDNSTADSSELSRCVIFVHGWSGDAQSFGELPRFLAQMLHFEELIYSYPTGWLTIDEKQFPPIRFVARNFDNWIRNNCNHEVLAVIAHSMGGTVTRKFLINQTLRRNSLESRFRQLTFVASPFEGLNLANFGKLVLGAKAQLTDLAPGSAFLDELNEDWKQWLEKHPRLKPHVRSIYSPSDKVVSPGSAYGTDPEPVPILGVGHKDIVKPSRASDEVVLTIARFLKSAGYPELTSAGGSAQPATVGE